MANNNHRPWKFLGLVVLSIIMVLSFFVLYRFIDVLLLGLALAYIVYPVARRINRGNTEAGYRYIVASLSAVGIVAIPMILLILYGLNFILHWFIKNLPLIQSGKFLSELRFGLDNAGLGLVSARAVNEIGKLIAGFSQQIGLSIVNPTFLIEIFVKITLFFIIAFYFVYEGPQIRRFFETHVPKKEKFLRELIFSFDKICYGLFVGHFFTSVIIAILFGVGYWIIFQPELILLGFLTVLMFIIAFLPLIGPWLIYIPLGAWQIIFNPAGSVQGIALLGFGFIFLTVIPDFYVRPKLIKKGSDIHPLLIILGFFGGPLVLGVKGIIIGPLVLGLAQAIITLYAERRHILKDLIDHF